MHIANVYIALHHHPEEEKGILCEFGSQRSRIMQFTNLSRADHPQLQPIIAGFRASKSPCHVQLIICSPDPTPCT